MGEAVDRPVHAVLQLNSKQSEKAQSKVRLATSTVMILTTLGMMVVPVSVSEGRMIEVITFWTFGVVFIAASFIVYRLRIWQLQVGTAEADCSAPADRDMIERKLEESGGFDALDSTILELRLASAAEPSTVGEWCGWRVVRLFCSSTGMSIVLCLLGLYLVTIGFLHMYHMY